MKLTTILEKAGRNINDITKIYHGKDHWCRCGCGGNYFEHNEKGFTRAINLLNKEDRFDFAVRADEIEFGECWINIPVGDPDANKCYCLYFDKK